MLFNVRRKCWGRRKNLNMINSFIARLYIFIVREHKQQQNFYSGKKEKGKINIIEFESIELSMECNLNVSLQARKKSKTPNAKEGKWNCNFFKKKFFVCLGRGKIYCH